MTIKEAVIKYIEYRHSLGEKFKSAGILLVSFSKFIGDTTDISSINMESVNSFLYKGNKVTAMWFARHTSLKGFFQWAFQRSLIETIPLTLDMPTTSNVLQYFTEDGTKVSIRPSGTEPKIKFYCEVHSKVKSLDELPAAKKAGAEKIEAIKASLGI